MSKIAETIRGINVMIGSDTTGLSKALGDVNKKSRDIQSELKQVEKLLKLDPSNTELVAQKQKLLSDAIATAGEKLNALKNAQEQVNEQFARGQITEGQYRAFQREIAAAEQSLNRFEQRAGGTKRTLKDLSAVVKDTGEKMRGIGERLSLAITAPVVGFATLVTQGTKELRGDLATLETNANVAGQSMDVLNDQMAKLAAVTGETDSNVEGLSNLLAAGFRDEQLTTLVDQLAGASLKFKDTLKFEGISDGLQETLATGTAIGPFAELLDRSGIALDGFNEGLTAAIANGTQQQYVLDVLTKSGLAGVFEAYKTGNPELIKNAEATYRMNKSMADLGTTIEPLLTPIIEKITQLINRFNEMSPTGQKIVLAIAGIAAAIGPLLLVIGSFAGLLGSLTIVAGGMGLTLGGLLLPIAGVVAAIGGLIAFGVLLYKNWDTVKAKASELLSAIENTFVGIGKSAERVINKAVFWGQSIVQGMINGITGFVDRAVAAASNLADNISATVKRILGIASPSKVMEEFGRYVAEGLAEGIKKNASKAEEAAEKMAQAIKNAASKVLGGIDGSFQLAIAGLEVKNMIASNNVTEIQKLKNQLQGLQLQLQQAAEKVDTLNAIYETSRKKLGENSEVTKQYKHDLEMAKIALEKLNVEIANNKVATEQASIDQQIKSQKELFDNYRKGLNEEVEKIQEVYEKRKELIDAEIEADNELIRKKEDLIDSIKKETNTQILSIQELMDALDDQEETSNREEAELKHNKKIAELQDKRNYEAIRTGREHKKNVIEIDKQIAEEQHEWELQKQKWAREDQREAYQSKIDAIEEQAQTRQDAIKDEINDIRKSSETKKNELEKYYSQVQKILSDKSLDMLAALSTSDELWYRQGLMWMDKLAQGIRDGSMALPSGASDFFESAKTTSSTTTTPHLIAAIMSSQYTESNGRTYMPSRSLAAMLDQPVEWDQANQKVKIGSKWFTPWKIEDGTSYVGIREVAETLGYTVGWDGSNVKIYKAAKGGIFHSPAITQIAEAGGSEVAAPLSTLLPMMQDALVSALSRIKPNFFIQAQPSPAMASDTIINLTFSGPITIRNENDIVQVSNRLGGLVRSTQRGLGRR